MDIGIYLRYRIAMLKVWQTPEPRMIIHKTINNIFKIFAYLLLLFAGYTYQRDYYLLLATSIGSAIFLLALYDYGLGKHRGWNRQRIKENAILLNKKERENHAETQNNTNSDNRELTEE